MGVLTGLLVAAGLGLVLGVAGILTVLAYYTHHPPAPRPRRAPHHGG